MAIVSAPRRMASSGVAVYWHAISSTRARELCAIKARGQRVEAKPMLLFPRSSDCIRPGSNDSGECRLDNA